MDLAIIIVTYNSRHIIGQCISSLGDLKGSVLVVDNGSTDGSAQYLEEIGIRVIRESDNLGYGRGANIGAYAVSATYVCFLNPDCVVTPDFFSKCLESLSGRLRHCAVPERVVHGDFVTTGIQPGYTRKKLVVDILETNYGQSKLFTVLREHAGFHDHSWHWPLGTCIVIEREFFLELNGFDPRFFMYCEDVNLGFRIAQMGGKIIPIDYELRHYSQNSSLISRSRKRLLLNNGRLLFAWLHYGAAFASFLRGILFLANTLNRARCMLRGIF